jgi:putative tricarboxylic transport membrane protein
VKKMSVGEKTGIVTLVFGILYGILTLNMERAAIGNPFEPLIFPLMLATLMLLCGAVLFIGEHKKRLVASRTQKVTEVKKEKKKFEISYEVKMIIFICIVSTLYGFLFDKIGYVLSTTFFMGALLFAFNGAKKWLVNLTIAISFSVVIYICFSRIFFIPLPTLPFFNI